MTTNTQPSRATRESAAASGLGGDVMSDKVASGQRRLSTIMRDTAVGDQAGRRPLNATPNAQAVHVVQGRRTLFEASKRAFDLVGGLALLCLSAPLILIAALVIRIETRGSPFFIQTRLGKDGKPFRIVKLRGMFIDARERFASYYDYSGKRDLDFCFHHEDDPRVTRAGRFIRKTSIDELPNLWNVVVGDMSLVGPRPEIPEVLALYGPYRDEYLSVKPGVTCLSKCTGRDRLTKRETIEFDLDYIRKRGFLYDLQILWRTFRGVVLRRDVFLENEVPLKNSAAVGT